jgi:Ca2+-binding EF-hand superfamily protein
MAAELSQETQQMFTVMDKYEDGEINLEEVVQLILAFAPIEPKKIREILNGIDRDNAINLDLSKS